MSGRQASGKLDNDAAAKRSVASIAYDVISSRIASGEYSANERLNEAQLVRELRVSRGAVREAMNRLASDGLIEIELNKGASIRAITRGDLSDFLQVRAVFESFAAHRAAERVNEPGVREAVLALLDQCSMLEAHPSPEGMVEHDTSFHSTVMDLSGSFVMSTEWRKLRRSRYRKRFLKLLSTNEILMSISQHREILFAILDGDSDLAGSFATKHVRLTNSRIQRMSNDQFEAIYNSTGPQFIPSERPTSATALNSKDQSRPSLVNVA